MNRASAGEVGCGVLILALCPLCGLAYLAAAFLSAADPAYLTLALMAGAGGLLCALAGVAVLVAGFGAGATSQVESRANLRWAVWLLAFAVLLLLGRSLLAADPLVAALALPPFHFLAAAVPAWALTIRLAGPIRVSRLAYGSCAATSLALTVETMVAGLAIVALALLLWPTAEWQTAIAELRASLESAGQRALDPDVLRPLLKPPLVLALFFIIGLVGPAVEELAKVLGIAIWPPTSLRQAWLQGAAIGAGFGLTEAIALGAAGGSMWPATMTVRASATLMHTTMSGLAGLGWFAAVRRRQAARGLVGLGGAIVGHGLWNTLVLGSALVGLVAGDEDPSPWAGLLGLAVATVWLGVVALYALLETRTRAGAEGGHPREELALAPEPWKIAMSDQMPGTLEAGAGEANRPPTNGAVGPRATVVYSAALGQEEEMPAIEYARAARDSAIQRLSEFLRIPSVSAVPEHDADIRRAAQWLVQRFEAIGVEEVRLDETAGHPVVYARAEGPPGAPAVLVYGHYDVQPAELKDGWTTPPFEPQLRGGAICARGASDDKGQVAIHLEALEAFRRTAGRPPVTVVYVIEGEEEIGSPHLNDWLERNADRLKADVALVSDTAMLGPDRPAITYGLRGLAYLEVEVRGPAHDLHSGQYGGAVVNPANALCAMLAKLHDADGRVAIPGFYDRVVRVDDAERASLNAVGFNEEAFRQAADIAGGYGEAGYTTLERLWIRPTLDVNGIVAGWTGSGAKTVLPAVAMAKISMRLVPDQEPAEIGRLASQYLYQIAPPGVRVTVRELQGAAPVVVDRNLPAVQAAAAALEEVYGRAPAFIREGGTVPAVASLRSILGIPPLLIGFALPDDNAHGPDEKFELEQLTRGIATVILLLERLGATAAP